MPQPITAAIGEAGEDHTLCYLQAYGLTMAGRSHRYKGSRIDLVICDAADALILVELHTRVVRSTQRFDRATASVTLAKQCRLIATAGDLLAWQAEDMPACRFDVIAVDGMRIEWIRDAFGVDA